MILNLISLVNYKNHENLTIKFSNYINCFLGKNGVGKTNLLDAIYYLSFCKSYYSNIEQNNIRFQENYFMIKGSYIDDFSNQCVVQASVQNKQKQIKFNGKKYDKLSNHIGKIPLVIITPMDSSIILGGNEERRRFFDKFLSQLDRNYINELINYNKSLQQRNILLKKYSSIKDADELLSIYDSNLCEYGNSIFSKRKECVHNIIKIVQKYYKIISNGSESIDIDYQSQLHNDDFAHLLNTSIKKDQFLTYTTNGIHRDDFVFKINNYSLKKTGSQGQQKSFLIALKFAYFEILKDILQIKPILLLDDIFDKLDYDRVEQIIRILNEKEFGQIFITDTSKDRVDKILNKVDIESRYFIFDKNGNYYEERKS